MYLPLYTITYTNNITNGFELVNFYTTRAARNFLYNNRNKIHDVTIYLYGRCTEISEKDLRD